MDARAMVEEKPYFASSIDAFVVLVGSIHSCHRSFARRVVGCRRPPRRSRRDTLARAIGRRPRSRAEMTKTGVRVDRAAGAAHAVVWLEREPVNSMTLEFWRALADALKALENDATVRATRARGKDGKTDGARSRRTGARGDFRQRVATVGVHGWERHRGAVRAEDDVETIPRILAHADDFFV